MMRSRILAYVVPFLLLLLPATKANAFVCCDPWGFVGQSAFVQAGSSVITTITTSATQLVGYIEGRLNTTLTMGFDRTYGELSKQTASRRVFLQGRLAADNELYMQEATARAAERGVTPAQQSATVTNALLLGEQSQVVRKKVSKLDADFQTYLTTPASGYNEALIERHRPYCSGADAARERCSPAAAPQLQDADLHINTVLNPGGGEYETYADDERKAAVAFVQNTIAPTPVVVASPQGAKSPQARAREAQLLADQAALSLAAHSLNASIAHRTRRHDQ